MSATSRPVELTQEGVSAADVVAVARGGARVSISAGAREALVRGASVVAGLAESEQPAYGVTTGFGALATVYIPTDRREELQRALIRSHAAGMGAPVEREVVRAMMLLRARTLCMGCSG
ncbi:MAG TPA: aromatic amino acid lyase, partial [Candidatus Limnocylindria bacterium]|nr:aromatic amino acid lyase [Candidatus Limnocylindria bacterium]